MNREYVCKQLWLMEDEIKDVYDTMVEHKFNLTPSDVADLIYKVNTRIGNIKGELKEGRDETI
ncbi:hypothetical protein UT300012_31930 [Paraclostridium bifermentans]